VSKEEDKTIPHFDEFMIQSSDDDDDDEEED
jgi:hypothetical protein